MANWGGAGECFAESLLLSSSPFHPCQIVFIVSAIYLIEGSRYVYFIHYSHQGDVFITKGTPCMKKGGLHFSSTSRLSPISTARII
jgi:uncharacterized membrane protein YwaF